LGGLAPINSHELQAQALGHPNALARQNTWQSLREGVDYVWKTPSVLLVILVVGLVLLFGANFNVVLPLFATGVLHVGATGFGFLSAGLPSPCSSVLFSACWSRELDGCDGNQRSRMLQHRHACKGLPLSSGHDVANPCTHSRLVDCLLIA